jgi:hypothetical protein
MTRTPGADPTLVERILMRLRATRLERQAGAVPYPADVAAPISVAGPARLRVLLFGTGAPAVGRGVGTQDEALGSRIADELAAATGRGVQLDPLIAEDWHAPDPFLALQRQELGRYDAIVVISTYRRELLEVPIDRWLGYVIEVREFLARESAENAVIQVLNLPWQRAADDAPAAWGGPLGRHIRTLDTLAMTSLDSTPDVLRLTLSAPEAPSEWVGTAFSAATYRRWGSEVAAQLAARFSTDVAPE